MDKLSTAVLGLIIGGLLFLGVVAVQAIVVKIGWSLFMVDYFSFAELDIYQAAGLALLMPRGSYTHNEKK